MKSSDDMFQDAQLLIEAGRTEMAIDALEELLSAYPKCAKAHFELGNLYWNLGEPAKALDLYGASIKLDPENMLYCKKLADLYYTQLGNVTEALVHYRKIIEMCPDDIETLMIVGNLHIIEKRFDKAADFYQAVLNIEPRHNEASSMLEKLKDRANHKPDGATPETDYRRSQVLFQAGDIEAAIKTLEDIIKAHPEFAPAHNDLGVLSYQCGLKDRALAYYQEAVRLEPLNSVYQKNLADLYYVELGRTQEALEIYLSVLQEDPTDIETLMAAGYICMDLNRLKNARVFCDRVLEIAPENADAMAMREKLDRRLTIDQESFNSNL